MHGHLTAATNPVGYKMRSHPDLKLENYGLTLWDLDRALPDRWLRRFRASAAAHHPGAPARGIPGSLSVELHVPEDPEVRAWFQERLERGVAKPTREEQLRVLQAG